jgi:hypothetical protein
MKPERLKPCSAQLQAALYRPGHAGYLKSVFHVPGGHQNKQQRKVASYALLSLIDKNLLPTAAAKKTK